MMASNQKSDVEQAVSVMMEILKTEPDYIPAIYVSFDTYPRHIFNFVPFKLGHLCWIHATEAISKSQKSVKTSQ